MASLDTDVTMVPAAEGSGGAGPSSSTASTSSSTKKAKRFEIKKWNAVSLWAWDIVVDNCAICRNHIMDLCDCTAGCAIFSAREGSYYFLDLQALNVRLTKPVLQVRNAQLLGGSAIMHFTFTVLADGLKLVKSVHW
ncbi:hypothetical protein OSB04_031310, partial [Centaurea solstitialis]